VETEVRPENLTLSRIAEKDSFVTSVNTRRVASFDDLIVTLFSIRGDNSPAKGVCPPDTLK
jgi:hypothetical protein